VFVGHRGAFLAAAAGDGKARRGKGRGHEWVLED
jgi:hypothetical protein